MTYAERYASIMWKKSRMDKGKSQQFMANALKVSKATIQHWEDGTSNPGKDYGLKWFEVLETYPLAYYIQALYEFAPMDIDNMDEKKIDDLLMSIITSLPVDIKSTLLYCLSNGKGGNPFAFLYLMAMNDYCPLKDRVNIAQTVYDNFEIAESLGLLPDDMPVRPDTKLVKAAIESGKEAVKNGKDSYTTMVNGLEINL